MKTPGNAYIKAELDEKKYRCEAYGEGYDVLFLWSMIAEKIMKSLLQKGQSKRQAKRLLKKSLKYAIMKSVASAKDQPSQPEGAE